MKRLNKRLLSVILAVILAVSAMPFNAVTASADDLSDAKTAFLNKVSQMYAYDGAGNGKLYKNSLMAYLAYIEACKPDAGSEEAAALASATSAMTEFTPYKGNETVKINGTTASGCYSNVLWSENPTALQYSNFSHGYIYWSNGVLKYGGDIFVYQPSAVLLYDGTTEAKSPVMFAEQENEGRYRFRFGYVAESGGRLKTDWKGFNTAPRNGTSTAVNAVWPTSSTNTIPRVSTPSSTSDDGYLFYDANVEHSDTCDFYNFRNALSFDLDNGLDYTTVINKEDYKGIQNYKKISKFDWTIHAYWYNVVTSSEHRAEGNTSLTTNNPIYIINYKKLLDKIKMTVANKKDSYLVDGTDFREGNSIGFFGAFDNVLSLDVSDTTKYDYESDPESASQSAGNDINEACIDLDEITSTAAAMSSIVTDINRFEELMADNPYRFNLADTYKLYLKAKECFDAYVFGQKNDDTSDADFLNYMTTIANDFDTALASFTPYASYTGSGDNKVFTADAITGNYVPDNDTKIFEGDVNGGTAGLATYKNAGAMNNVLYYPTVTRANGVRAETDTLGNGNHTYTVDGREMPFNGDGDGTNHFTVYYPAETVLVYNGDSAPAFPVLSGIRNAHSTVGVENYTTAAYPTDSATLKEYNSRYLDDVDGYSSQKVNGVSYADGYYPFVKSTDSVTDVGLFGTKRYNVRDTNKGPRAPEESAAFNIKAFSERYTYDNQYATNNKYWKGIHTERDSNNLPLSWVNAWNTDTSGITGSGAIYGSPTEWWSRYYDLKADDNHGKAEISIAASAVELVVNPFEGKTKSDGAEYYTANYNGPNWYHSFQEVRATTDLNVEIMLDKGSKIRILNVIPAMNAKQQLLECTDAQDILGAIFQYDKDSADVIEFLEALDEIGSFNPNTYDYSQATTGTPEYSENAGVEQACIDMAALQTTVANALDYVDDSTDSDHSTVNDGKINLPTDAESTSTNTTNPGTGWYADLRTALLDPLEADACTNDEAYAAYKAVLDKAQDAIAYSAMSKVYGDPGSDYEATYTYEKDGVSYTETIQDIAAELIEATEAFKNAPAMHAYIYEDENENQMSMWDCTANASHNHATADMSAYNELEIAYNTIDREAYKNFDELLGSKHDDGDYTDDTTDPDNISFVEIKKRATQKGEAPQDFVDHGIARLLEAINEASEEQQGQESHLNTYRVSFIVRIDGEEPSTIIDNEAYAYNSNPTFDATQAPAFNIYGATCYKWTVKIGDGEEVSIRNYTSALSYTVRSDCTVTAYATKAASAGQIKVKIAGATSAFQYGMNVDPETPITFGEADENGVLTITVGANNYVINSTPAYKNIGWTIGTYANTTAYTGSKDEDDNDYTAGSLAASLGRSELYIYPLTELRATGSYRIQLLGETEGTISSIAKADDTVSQGEEVNGVMTLSGVKYDDLVTATFTPDTTKGTLYAMVINEAEMAGGTIPRYVPISYSNTYTFYANSYMNFYPLYVKTVLKDGIASKVYYVDDGNETRITNATDLYHLQHYIPFVINLMDTQNVPGKHIFRTIYTANIPESAGVRVTEHGRVYFSTTNQTVAQGLAIGESDCVIGNKWTFDGHEYSITKKVASGQVNAISNQYAYNSTNPSSGFKYVISRGYIKYEYPFSQTVIENGVETTYTATIEGIEYGRADTYTYPSN